MEHFALILLHYLHEIIPALAVGFFISGLVHEFLPEDMVTRYLGYSGIKPIFWATLIGTFLPICCWGTLPIAVSFHKKGARLGPVLAFLIATPATSISALLVTYSVLGFGFALYTFFAVIIMGITVGLIGNAIKYTPRAQQEEPPCPHCKAEGAAISHDHSKKTFGQRISSILGYAYIKLPKEIGLEIIIGVVLAAVVAVFVPIGNVIKLYFGGAMGYVFSVVFGIITYICSTASIPLIDSLMKQGMNSGAAMTLLLLGPVTSYGTILVLRKEFGVKTLALFLLSLIILTVTLGIGFDMLVH